METYKNKKIPTMIWHTLTQKRLMEESENCMEKTLGHGTPRQRSIVNRIYDNPRDFARWESAHCRLMRDVARKKSAAEQLFQLRKTYCGLISNTALVDLLRENRVSGMARKVLFEYFYASLDYDQAILIEHGRFLHGSSSLLCADHLQLRLMQDRQFIDTLDDYKETYAQYFSLFCNAIIAEKRGEDYMLMPLIKELKNRLVVKQAYILSLPFDPPRRFTSPADVVRTSSVGFIYH
jgi:hypothetical protein